MVESMFQLINTLLVKLNVLQKDDTRVEMLFRRVEQIQRILVDIDHLTRTESTTFIKLNTLLSKANIFFEQYSGIVRTLSGEHNHELDTINSELMNILLQLTIDPMQKVKLLAEILKNDQKLEQEKYEAEIHERQTLRRTLLYVQLADNKQILCCLNNEFGSIIKPYVDRCIRIHLTIPVRGINREDVDQGFASLFYKKEQSIPKRIEVQLDMSVMSQINIPVNSAYIQLRADKSTAFERRQARDFLLHTVAPGDRGSNVSNQDIWKRLASAPYMPSLLERDRFSNEKQRMEERISPGKAIQIHRWMVILGDPGSGKTTLVRWLALQFAQAFQENNEQGVQLSFLDENTSKLETIHIGPLRLPITVRLGEYADAVRLNPSLSLFDYIGEHTWMGDSFNENLCEIERKQFSDILKNYIRAGQALIILDGLDEIPESENRSRIVEHVETFVEQFVRTPSSVSAFDQEKYGGLGWIALSDLDSPQNCGGNQIIVTSRIVGYHAGPLKGSFVHFTIEPLGLSNIEMFIDHWFDGVHRQLLNILDLAPPERIIRTKVREHTAVLKSEIRNSENRGLRELISNSLLLSAICSMSFRAHREGIQTVTLPNHRVHLYEDAVEWMLNAWQMKDPKINIVDVKKTLCQLAAYIHKNSASGLIDQSTLIDICRSNLNATVDETSEERAINFTRTIRDEVGVLAARGEFAYGFLHLTFQEYLTGLAFIFNDHSIETVVHRFIENMGNPRYREPLLLALGLISWKWSSEDYDLFCKNLLEEQEHQNENFSSLVPLGALLLISSLNDLVKLPSDTFIFYAFDQLLLAAGKHNWFIDHPNLAKIIVEGLYKLKTIEINKWALRFLTASSSRTISQISAFCYCLIRCAAYQLNISSDISLMCSTTILEWVDSRIVNLLWNYLSRENEDKECIIDLTLMQLVHIQPSLFDSPRLRFRSFAIIRQQSIPPFLLPLIIAIYGGLDRNVNTNEVTFSAQYIHRDSSLTPLLRRYFIHQNKDEELTYLINYCQRIIETLNPNDCSLKSVDCFLALFCLMGVEEGNLFKIYSQYRAFKIAQQRMKRILFHLCQMYFYSEKKKATVLKDATNLLNISIDKIIPSTINSAFNYTSALLYGTNCLISSKTSFLFAEKKNDSDENSSAVMKSPQLFQNIEQLEKIVFTNMNTKSLPKLLRLFWPTAKSVNKIERYDRCVQLDACGQIMALRHDNEPIFALAFLPSWLEDIYITMLKHDKLVFNKSEIPLFNISNKFSLVHVLADLSKTFNNNSGDTFSIVLPMIVLYSLFKRVKLEYFAVSFIWRLSSSIFKSFFNNMMKSCEGEDPNLDELVATLTVKDESESIRCAIDTELQRYTEIITKNIRNDDDIYSCALSLSHICWFDATANKWTLFKNALHLMTLISNVASRLHLITVILSNLSIKSITQEHVDLTDLLQNQFLTTLNTLYTTVNMSPFVTVFLIGRCAEHINTSDYRKRLMQQAIKEYNHLLNCSLPGEAFNFDRFLHSMFPECSSFGSIPLHSSKSGLLRQELNSMTYTSELNLNEQMTLTSCYLANLSFDIHRMNCVSFDRTLADFSMTNNSNLSVTVALLIDRWIVSMEMDDYQKLDDFLDNFTCVDSAARLSVTQWLDFDDDDKRRFLSFYASLLLARSSMWTPKVMNILCDLLLNKVDRYRQRAEDILLRGGGSYWRSSDLDWPVFQTLIDKHFSYHKRSAYASVITLWTFEKIEIDDVDHLDKLLMYEKELIQKKLINEDRDEQQSRNQMPTMRSVINRLSSSVLHHFIKIVEDAVNKCSKPDVISSVENRIDVQYVLHLFNMIGIFNRAVAFQDSLLINMCDRVLSDKHMDIAFCKAVLFALRYCGSHGLPLLRSFFSTPYKEITVVSTAVESYCNCLSSFYYELSDEEKNTTYSLSTISDLLNNSSEEIAQTTATGLARIYASCNDGLSILMKTLNNDSIQCYTALLNATRDNFVDDASQHAIEKCAECIEQNTSLLSLFILELYESILHYDSTLHRKYTLFDRGDIQFVEIAALLVKSMSAAFRAEVDRCGLTSQIKQALFFTSKQHNYPRRAACIAVLSCFGDLTGNMCNMFLSGLLDTRCSQKTVYECITRIQRVSELDSFSILDSFLSSPSMNTRYAVTQLLILLTRQGVITVKNCQDTLCRMIINMSSSFKDIWSHREEMHSDAISNYDCVGRLDKIVYTMLIDMSFSMSSEMDNISSIRSNLLHNSSYIGELDHFFEQKMKNFKYTRLQNVGKSKQFDINIDADDTGARSDHKYTFGRRHKHFPSFFFQSLRLKRDGYTLPAEVRAATAELNEIAARNNVDESELYTYAFEDHNDVD